MSVIAFAPLVIATHLLAAVVALALGARRSGGMSTAAVPVLLGLAAGPAGLVIGLAMAAILRRWPGDAPLADWAALLRGGGTVADRRTGDRVADDRIRQPSPAELASLYDMQQFGTVEMRQCVVATVVRSFQPALSPVIARALVDPDQSIRAQAAAAATGFQNQFTIRRRALEDRAEASGTAADALRLATLLAETSEIVLFSDRVRATLRTEAIARLRTLRDRAPSPAIDARLAGLMMADGDAGAAVALLDADSVPDPADGPRFLAYADGLFRSGDFDRLRAACAGVLTNNQALDARLAAIVEFWGRQPSPA